LEIELFEFQSGGVLLFHTALEGLTGVVMDTIKSSSS